MLIHIKEILTKAQKQNYALGAFNTFNLETTLGIIEAAQACRAPIIIQVTEKTILQYTGLELITNLIKTAANDKEIKTPIALHLDHCKNFQLIIDCIKAGFSSVMIDASDLPFGENIRLTKRVVDYAHRHKVLVQGEIGRVVKKKEEIEKLKVLPQKFLTDPVEAEAFVRETGVDVLAVAIGNVHGAYKIKHGVPKLFLDHLSMIQQRVKIPMVLHGASGVTPMEIKRSIELGIRIINIDTEIRLAFIESLREGLKNKDEYDPRKILIPTIERIRQIVQEKIKIFGSFGKR